MNQARPRTPSSLETGPGCRRQGRVGLGGGLETARQVATATPPPTERPDLSPDPSEQHYAPAQAGGSRGALGRGALRSGCQAKPCGERHH